MCIYQPPLDPTGCQGQVATKERKTNRLLLGKTDWLLELSCSSHTPHPHLFLKVLLSISERRRGTIKNTFVTLNPKCPSTQNQNTVKPIFPCLFYLPTCLLPPIRKSQFIESGCNSFKTKAYQNCQANTQVERMCWTDSSSWSHSTHLSWMREASLCWSICCPAFISNGKP